MDFSNLSNMFKKISNTKLPLLLLIGFSVIVYRIWVSFDVFFSGDWVYYYPTALKTFANPSIWTNLYYFGSTDLFLWRLPVNFLQGLFGILNFSSNVSEKFLY